MVGSQGVGRVPGKRVEVPKPPPGYEAPERVHQSSMDCRFAGVTPRSTLPMRGRAVWAAVGSVQHITAATPAIPNRVYERCRMTSSSLSLARSYCGRVEYGLPPNAFEIAAIARCARMLLPASSSGGETTAMPNLPGETAMMPPPTPLLAGSPV